MKFSPGDFRDAFVWRKEQTGATITHIVQETGISRDIINKLISRSLSSTSVENAIALAGYFGQPVDQFIDEALAERKSYAAGSSPADPRHVAVRLQRLRGALNLSKSEIADAIGIDRSSYIKIEAGQKALKPEWACRLWDLYQVSCDYVYRGELESMPDELRVALE